MTALALLSHQPRVVAEETPCERGEELAAAITEGALPRLESLLASGIGVDCRLDRELRTPLLLAVEGARAFAGPEIVLALLEHGADPELQDRDGETALLKAVKLGQSRAAVALLERGADPLVADDRGNTALGHAAGNDDAALVERLLASGVPADHQPRDGSGQPAPTPLMHAAGASAYEAARVLLEHGASPRQAGPRGRNAFDVARQRNDGKMASLLARGG